MIPSVGNHDTWPINNQDFRTPNSNWPINHFKDSWIGEHWLSEQEIEVFQQYGFYSKAFEFDPKGKMIALNMQACNNANWWLIENRFDPGDQLKWLEAELAQLERDGGYAHLSGHIPPQECLHQFGIRFKALIERYQNVVRYSSFGHTHDEEFLVNVAINSTSPTSFAYVAGSATTSLGNNPAFTVIDFDAEYMVPTNLHTYYMNMTEANLHPDQQPIWTELHDWVGEYGLKDMSPSSILEFTDRLYNDADLASQYLWNKARRAGSKPEAQLHDKALLCRRATETFESKDCLGEPHIGFKGSGLFEYFMGNWIKIKSG